MRTFMCIHYVVPLSRLNSNYLHLCRAKLLHFYGSSLVIRAIANTAVPDGVLAVSGENPLYDRSR